MPYLSPYHHPVPISVKFRENIEIPRKWGNSAARLKIPRKTVVPNHHTDLQLTKHLISNLTCMLHINNNINNNNNNNNGTTIRKAP